MFGLILPTFFYQKINKKVFHKCAMVRIVTTKVFSQGLNLTGNVLYKSLCNAILNRNTAGD